MKKKRINWTTNSMNEPVNGPALHTCTTPNQRMDERTNKRMNECLNECLNEWMNKLRSERANERTSERAHEQMNENTNGNHRTKLKLWQICWKRQKNKCNATIHSVLIILTRIKFWWTHAPRVQKLRINSQAMNLLTIVETDSVKVWWKCLEYQRGECVCVW
jgi:hypothetical protein